MLHIALGIISVFSFHHAPKPFWYDGTPSCPLHYTVYEIQSRAVQGRQDATICIKEQAPKPRFDQHTMTLACPQGFLTQNGKCVFDRGQCEHDCKGE